MKDLWKYLAKCKKETVLAPLFKMLEALFELFIPLVVADIIDVGIANGDMDYIIRRGILMILLGVAGFAFAVVAQYFSAKAAVAVSSNIRKDLFYHISDLSYSQLDSIGVSALITSMTSDINQVRNGINYALRLFMRSPFIVIGAGIMAAMINPRASLIFWGVIALLALVIFSIMKITAPMNANVQESLEKVMRSFRENLIGARVIRAFNRQSAEKEQFDRRHDTLYKSQTKVGSVAALLNPLTFAIVNFGIVLIMYFGSVNVSIGSMTQGQVVSLYNYMSQILVELIKLANVIQIQSKAVACFKRIMAVLKTKAEARGGLEKFDHLSAVDIKLNNLTFSYHNGANPVIDGVSCHIPAGANVGIIGATASGKTTLVNLLAGFYERTLGDILLNGLPIEEYSTEALTENIAVVPQKSVLFKGTLRGNLLWGDAAATDKECFEALSDSCAYDFVADKGQGLDMPIAQNGRNLSGGQRQRLCIARALLKKSRLLILDDSYSALDYFTQSAIKEALRKSKAHCTVLTVSQRVTSIYDSDLILVLDKGRLVGAGTHDELLKTCPVYGEICESQNFVKGEIYA